MSTEAPEARWAAVVVNYEAGPLLLSCVRSLMADESAGAPEIVVIDNGSNDGSADALRREFAQIDVVGAEANLGYAAAANRGMASTTAPVVLVCNPDVELRSGTAAAMLARFDAEAALAAVGPEIRNVDGSTYPSARSEPAVVDALGHGVLGVIRPRNRFTRRYLQIDADPHLAREVDWLSGAAIFLRRSALDSIGGWDERFFMYMEDVDVCWRLRRGGWRIEYEPAGMATHVQGASTVQRPYRMIIEHHRSAYRFANKRWRGPRRAFLLPAAVLLTCRAAAALVVRAVGHRPGPRRVSG
ncbi:MAG TPA: glycosyltransferase family 2 protein [Acidimicrobiia bacterium]